MILYILCNVLSTGFVINSLQIVMTMNPGCYSGTDQLFYADPKVKENNIYTKWDKSRQRL